MDSISGVETSTLGFSSLELPQKILDTLTKIGYHTPSPIQTKVIPFLLNGQDVIGQAETGTGKTGAFALPLLANLDTEVSGLGPQILVLAPTRELALQVASAFKKYGESIKNLKVLPMYGGQGYRDQLRDLKSGVHIVVGTPGRVIDHLERGTMKLSGLKTIVLDEADEMLRMGFYEDVETILSFTPKTKQVALFSATMPDQIKKIIQKHLNEPVQIKLNSSLKSSSSVKQSYWVIQDMHKLDALNRVLDTTETDGVIAFVRTKQGAIDLAEHLGRRGFKAAPLNGDIPQAQREQTIKRFKSGQFDILVATDVAARGLDIDRIGLVINYDMPYDSESYVHRIGRTGRAGTTGSAILFVCPREARLFKTLERELSFKLEKYTIASAKDINKRRIDSFKAQINAVSQDNKDIEIYKSIVEELKTESGLSELEVATRLISLLYKKSPLILEAKSENIPKAEFDIREAGGRGDRGGRGRRFSRGGGGGSRGGDSRGGYRGGENRGGGGSFRDRERGGRREGARN